MHEGKSLFWKKYFIFPFLIEFVYSTSPCSNFLSSNLFMRQEVSVPRWWRNDWAEKVKGGKSKGGQKFFLSVL